MATEDDDEEMVEPVTAAEATSESEPDAATEEGFEKEVRKLTEAQWAQIVDMWERGTHSSAEIRKLFPISRQAMSRGLIRRGAKQGCRAHEVASAIAEKVIEKVADAASAWEAGKRTRIDEMRLYFDRANKVLSEQSMRMVSEALRAGLPIGAKNADLNALMQVAKILRTTREERFVLNEVGHDVDPNKLPELPILDLTDERIEEMRQRGAGDELDELEATVLAGEGDDEIVELGEGEDGS